MAKTIRVTGKIVYQDLGMGFWGIVGDDGREWLPVNLPTILQVKGKRVRVNVRQVEDGVSMFMWGTMVELVY